MTKQQTERLAKITMEQIANVIADADRKGINPRTHLENCIADKDTHPVLAASMAAALVIVAAAR